MSKKIFLATLLLSGLFQQDIFAANNRNCPKPVGDDLSKLLRLGIKMEVGIPNDPIFKSIEISIAGSEPSTPGQPSRQGDPQPQIVMLPKPGRGNPASLTALSTACSINSENPNQLQCNASDGEGGFNNYTLTRCGQDLRLEFDPRLIFQTSPLTPNSSNCPGETPIGLRDGGQLYRSHPDVRQSAPIQPGEGFETSVFETLNLGCPRGQHAIINGGSGPTFEEPEEFESATLIDRQRMVQDEARSGRCSAVCGQTWYPGSPRANVSPVPPRPDALQPIRQYSFVVGPSPRAERASVNAVIDAVNSPLVGPLPGSPVVQPRGPSQLPPASDSSQGAASR